MTEPEVMKYRNFFALLVFHDMQVEQNGGGEDAMIEAGKTLRGISQMTAAFGPGPLRWKFNWLNLTDYLLNQIIIPQIFTKKTKI